MVQGLPRFIAAKSIKSFITKDLLVVLTSPLHFRHPGGGVRHTATRQHYSLIFAMLPFKHAMPES